MPASLRVLFSTGSPANYMAPPRLGDEQVNCGPHCPDAKDSSGRVISLATPAGEYDLGAVAARLGADQQPDLVVCLVDSSWQNLPRNLGAFTCPRVLLLADTHHLRSPLLGTIRYLAAEKFDRVVLLYDRHHAGLLLSLGFRNLYWFPGLTFPHDGAAVRAARRRGGRSARIAFVGQASHRHPRRERLIAGLASAGLPIVSKQIPQAEALAFYGSSTIGFNASLNGDLNLRVIELMAAGTAVLTDQLAPESGLPLLADGGRNLLTYASAAELAERAAHLLAHPAESAALGAAGARWFDEHLGPERRADAFRALAFDGTPVPAFDFAVAEKIRVFFPGDVDRLLQCTIVYERVQELHRSQEEVTIDFDGSVPADAEALFRTLPRLAVRRGAWTGDSDLSVQAAAAPAAPAAPRLWCWDAAGSDAALQESLAGRGYALQSSDVALYTRFDIAEAAECERALARGEFPVALERARRALAANPCDSRAAAVVARLALRAGDKAMTTRMIRLLLATDPAHPLVRAALAGGAKQPAKAPTGEKWAEAAARLAREGKFDHAAELFLALCQREPDNAGLGRGYAEALIGAGRSAEAMAMLKRLTLRRPGDAALQLALGHAASGAQHWRIAERAFAAAALPAAEPGLAEARRAASALAVPDEGYDLVVCHLEISRLQGTGVLLQRFLHGSTRPLITLRSNSLYKGCVEVGGWHWVVEGFGLSVEQREARLRELLAPYRIRRILCVPYYPADFLNAALVKKITGAPLCTYVMDDQTVCGDLPVPREVARWLLASSDVRLAISPEMRGAYEKQFGLPMGVLPPIVVSAAERTPNRWEPGEGPPRCVLVGNIWSRGQFDRLRALIRSAGLAVDWFGNADVGWIPQDRAELERDGIYCRGFLPESELARRLADYPFVLVPSGELDGTEDNEPLTRLSLPSRMVFILTQTYTPMLVLGSPQTAAAGYIRRLGIGVCASYHPTEAGAAIRTLLDPAIRARLVANARRVADAFVVPQAGEWIWASLAAGRPLPSELTELMDAPLPEAAVEVLPLPLPVAV